RRELRRPYRLLRHRLRLAIRAHREPGRLLRPVERRDGRGGRAVRTASRRGQHRLDLPHHQVKVTDELTRDICAIDGLTVKKTYVHTDSCCPHHEQKYARSNPYALPRWAFFTSAQAQA